MKGKYIHSHKQLFRLGKVKQSHKKNSKTNRAGSRLLQLSTVSWSENGCTTADSRIVTMEHFTKIKIQNNNYSNIDKSISPLPIHYTCGALRYWWRNCHCQKGFSTWNKAWINRNHEIWCIKVCLALTLIRLTHITSSNLWLHFSSQ